MYCGPHHRWGPFYNFTEKPLELLTSAITVAAVSDVLCAGSQYSKYLLKYINYVEMSGSLRCP